MDAFIVELENRPGMLAGLTEAIAARGINIEGVAAATSPERGSVALLTSDTDATRSVLDESGVTYRTCGVVEARLEHRPGSLAAAARRLADAGVNVEALLPTGMEGGTVTLALAVDDVEAAGSALAGMGAG